MLMYVVRERIYHDDAVPEANVAALFLMTNLKFKKKRLWTTHSEPFSFLK